ncbi:MAG: hypothetical protein AAF970_06325 [Bacteroidota bacterium]
MSETPTPATLQHNLQRLSHVARTGFAQAGRGVVVVEFAEGRPAGLHYLPEAQVYAQLAEAPILLELAVNGLEQYQPRHQAAILAYNVEGGEPLAWIIDLAPDQRPS